MHVSDGNCWEKERHHKHTTLSHGAMAGGTRNRLTTPIRSPAAYSISTSPTAARLHIRTACKLKSKSCSSKALRGNRDNLILPIPELWKLEVDLREVTQLSYTLTSVVHFFEQYIKWPCQHMCAVIFVALQTAHVLLLLWIVCPTPQIIQTHCV